MREEGSEEKGKTFFFPKIIIFSHNFQYTRGNKLGNEFSEVGLVDWFFL